MDLSVLTQSLKPGESMRAEVTLGMGDSGIAPVACPVTAAVVVAEVCPVGARYEAGPQSGPILYVTERGRARLMVGDGEAGWHQPGTLVVVASGQSIREEVEDGQAWAVSYALLAGEWAGHLDNHLRGSGRSLLVTTAARARAALQRLVASALAQVAGWEWEFLAAAATLLGDLYAGESVGDSLAGRVARVLDADPAARPTVAELAAAVGVTPRQLLYRLRLETGVPLATWTRQRRARAAERLLAQGQSVARVSEQLGFANPYHFSRVFKAVVGIPPSGIARVRPLKVQTAVDIPLKPGVE